MSEGTAGSAGLIFADALISDLSRLLCLAQRQNNPSTALSTVAGRLRDVLRLPELAYPREAEKAIRAALEPVPGRVVTEYGAAYKSGDVRVFCPDPDVEEVAPMASRIEGHQRNGGTVLRRRVIVVEDWQEAGGS